MHVIPPDPRPAPTLSPAAATDLLWLAGYARRRGQYLLTQADNFGPNLSAVHRRDGNTWQRIADWAQSSADGAQLIVRHEVRGRWTTIARDARFWVGMALGAAQVAAAWWLL